MPSHASRLSPIALSTIEDICGTAAAARGRGIFSRGDVLAVTAVGELDELMGLVIGSAPEPYVQQISLSAATGNANDCTCPVGGDCKHVAAVLYQYVAHREEILRGKPLVASSVDRWLGELGAVLAASEKTVTDAPAPGRPVLLYRLEVALAGEHASIGVTPLKSRLLKAGGFGKESPARLSSYHLPDWCTDLDRDIVALVESIEEDGYYRSDRAGFGGTSGARLMRLLVESGRCFVGDDRSHPIVDGGPRALELRWVTEDDRPTDLALPDLGPAGRVRSGRVRSDSATSDHDRSGRDASGGEEPDTGRLALVATLDDATHWHLLPTTPPWYLDEPTRRVGPVTGAPPSPVLQYLLAAPTLDADQAQRASELVSARLPGASLPPPSASGAVIVDEPPAPVLTLGSRDGSSDPRDFVAALGMRYGIDTLPYEGALAAAHATLEDEDGRRLVRRHLVLEVQRLHELAFHCPELKPLEQPDVPSLSDERDARGSGAHGSGTGGLDEDRGEEDRGDEDTANARPGHTDASPVDGGRHAIFAPRADDIVGATFAWRAVLAALPDLEAEGWIVETQPPFGLEFTRLDDIDAVVSETGSWFELSLAMLHAGERFALLPLIVEWLEAGEPERPILVQAESGEWLEIAPEIYLPVAETLTELFDSFPEGETLRLPTPHALLLDELERRWREAGGKTLWQGGERLFTLVERMKRFDGIQGVELPDTVHASLRPYQLDGVAWLGFLAEHGFGGILADDMGLGKTLQTLAHLAVERASGRLAGTTLVIAPTSLLGNWAREAERFVPDLRVAIWHGGERHERGLDLAELDLVITSYTLALRDVAFLAERPFELLVLDEAQQIKNPAAKTTRAVKALPIERRLCLSGTPLENHLGELWSQFDFLMPEYLGSQERFTRRFRTPIEKHGDDERQRRLNALTRPFMLRRKKEDVASDLPSKTEIVQSVTLGAGQSRLYESIRLSMEKRVRKLLAGKGLARSHIELLDALLKLRQCCCHPALVKLPSARKVHDSAKTEQLLTMLDELVAEGRRVLVFSQFTTMLTLIERELDARGMVHVKLTGRTRRRDAVVDAFQKGDAPIFLISLKAGGTGLNLTAADTVIHYDPWWNPAVEAQASARAHRIGQDKPVFVYRLVAADTVEERILEMQEKKRRLADAAIDGDGTPLAELTADDLLGLFAKREEAD